MRLIHGTRKIVCIGVIFLTAVLLSADITINLTPAEVGGWSFGIDAGDLEAGAGSDLSAEYESDATAEYIDIQGCSGSSDTWEVSIKRTDDVWDTDITLQAKVSSKGNGSGSFSGAGVYKTVSATDTVLFSGSGDRSDIAIQFKISGISITTVPDKDYATDITYTVVNTQ